VNRWALAIALTGVAACAGILGFKSAERRPFEHRAHVLQGIPCVDCHAGVETAGETGSLHLPDSKSCLKCHEKPHDTRACLGCHGAPFTASDLMQAREHLRFTHAGHSALTEGGKCVKCHGGIAREGEQLRPPMATCLGCHEHRDQFKTRDCNACHVDLPAELTQPSSHLVHDGDFLREHGARAPSAADLCATCHRESFCADCHGATVPALASRFSFDDPMRAGMHRAGFRARHSSEARTEPGLCTTCHQQRFCNDCHTDNRVAGTGDDVRNPHPAGWVGLSGPNEHGPAARRDPVSCASCHGGAGEALCVSCHQVGGVGGSPHPIGWTSRRSLGERPCSLCHITGPR
jgi:hypothetical protein